MTSKEKELIKQAINYLTDNDGSKFEDGMLILYRLAQMYNAVRQIEHIRNATGVNINELPLNNELKFPK